MNDLQKEGWKILSKLSDEDKNNAHILYDINQKYKMGYNYIIEGCSPRLMSTLYNLKQYTSLDFDQVLKYVAYFEDALSKNGVAFAIDGKIEPTECLEFYFNVPEKKAEQIVKIKDRESAIEAKFLGESLAISIREVVNNCLQQKDPNDVIELPSQEDVDKEIMNNFILGKYNDFFEQLDEQSEN